MRFKKHIVKTLKSLNLKRYIKLNLKCSIKIEIIFDLL